LALAQERRQRPHVLAREPVAHARLPGRLELQPGVAHGCCAGDAGRRDRRSWNSALVASRRSSIGLSTRSLAPCRSKVAWLARLAAPVITSTRSRRLPSPRPWRTLFSTSPPSSAPVRPGTGHTGCG